MAATVSAASRRSLVPWYFAGGLGLVVAVNGALVYFSVSSWTGLAVTKPYERGIRYNAVLAEQRRQDALGWYFEAAFRPSGEPGRGIVEVSVAGLDGLPLDGLSLEGRLVRPVEVLDDQPVEFRAAGAGRYVAAVTAPKAGQWDLKLTARRDGDHYAFSHRLVIR